MRHEHEAGGYVVSVGAKRSQPEYALTVATADFLRAVLPPEVLWFHVPNGEHRSPIIGAKLKRMGVRRGVADFMLAWRGDPLGMRINKWSEYVQEWATHVLWIELKALKGRQSSDQLEFQRDCLRAGHAYAVAHSIAEVEQILKARGVPMRGKIAA